ncbi:MAG: hypothetical protein WB755_12135, partial [Terriglobales bacterium]
MASGAPSWIASPKSFISVGGSVSWQWDQAVFNTRNLVEVGVYEVELKTENRGSLRRAFAIATPRAHLKTVARRTADIALGLGTGLSSSMVVASLAGGGVPLVPMSVSEAVLLALYWALDRHANDPPQANYTHSVEPKNIRLTLPTPTTDLQKSANSFAECIASVVVGTEALTTSLELYDLAIADNAPGHLEWSQTHSQEVKTFSGVLEGRLSSCIERMDEFAVPLRSSNIPLRMGQATIASFQERVLKEGLPRIDETLTEADVLRQFSLEGRDIAGIIQKIG